MAAEDTVFVILEDQSDWSYSEEAGCSNEFITTVPIRVFAVRHEAEQYVKDSNSTIMRIVEVPLGAN